ncbi:RagB/SusD family nutrient uptake outer membrane protein [Maribacter algarum]|uniref:RagB/SusD family nutrient uptake outer membrane protein n=1 Tax=Maribacter algarum (ex Zhang et al. 2020) TaxID=2578118 RepID=A0A5S3PQ28_9FLAO|nr:RagB/SusD family nutrient uptake outer membrane protein [Maribacter algarum]TMM56739.1 RagB/SusD family nutrient uptake outer membrane protein [Maribacter algarum]
MKYISIVIASLFLITACDNDLDQIPPKQIEASNLTDYNGALNAAYHYQTGTPTPLAIMGDFRADNMLMDEEPYPAFDRFNSDLAGGDLVEQFFRPFYSNLYKAILSANNVINNSSDATQVAEARFLRGLSYFKLVMVFGDVTVNLSESPDTSDSSILVRQAATEVYNSVIIPDLQAAASGLDNSGVSNGRVSQIAARGFLGKVYMYRGDYSSAATELAAVINTAEAAGVSLETDIANVVADGNSEVLFATSRSSSIPSVYTAGTGFPGWFSGGDTKSLTPLDPDLVAAFDAVANDTLVGGDLRRALTIDEGASIGLKYPENLEQDFIEMRLSDVILMYAEALNETGSSAAEVLGLLDDIRTRAGLNALDPAAINTQALVKQALADERRLELAFEGHRWFDLVRTGTVDAEMGETINSNYHVFPIPNSEVLASGGAITQNPGY